MKKDPRYIDDEEDDFDRPRKVRKRERHPEKDGKVPSGFLRPGECPHCGALDCMKH